MSIASIQGTLTVSPPASSSGTFPNGQTTIQLAFATNPKPAAVNTGVQQKVVTSPGGFAELSGVGPDDTVTMGTLLYIRASAPVQVEITTFDPLAPMVPNVAVLPIAGLVGPIEFDPTRYLIGLAVKGSATVEWLVAGPQ